MTRRYDYTGQITKTHDGNRILAFSYPRQAGNLIGDWSAELASGEYVAGDPFDTDVMKNGIITSAMKDPDGRVILQGKDAGVRLMRPCPAPSTLPEGGASIIISDLCDYCGIPVVYADAMPGLGFNARSVITGTTCSDAILELALLTGKIAYISKGGELVLVTPTRVAPTLPVPLNDGGTALNTDGYATQVGVLLTRRMEKDDGEGGSTYYNGTTPPGTTTTETSSGSFNVNGVTGTWSVEKIMPLDIIRRSVCSITSEGVTTVFTEEHAYSIQSMAVWRGTQEFRLFAWLETGYVLTKESSGSYEGQTGAKTFSETTTETMTRNISIFDDPAIHDEWAGQLGRVDRESILRVTARDGGPPPPEGDPTNSPPFDEIVERVYNRADFGSTLICTEKREAFEKRAVGRNSPVKDGRTGQSCSMLIGGVQKNQWTSGFSFQEWVKRRTMSVTIENYDDKGNLKFSSSANRDDDGAQYIIEQGWCVVGDPQADKITEEWLKFTQKSDGLDASPNSSGIISTMWQFLELDGREIVTTEGGINSADWYQNGTYVPSRICPHYSAGNCRISSISTVPPMTGTKCPRNGLGWRSCLRAVAALEQARQEEDKPQLAPPVYGEAGVEGVQYLHELTVEEIMTDAQAEGLANALATNILLVKSTKGVVRTVSIPYDSDIEPTGSIVGVTQDLAELTTTVSYLEDAPIPLFLLPGAYSSAIQASGRESARRDRLMVGTVSAVSGTVVTVKVRNVAIRCSSKLVGIGVGDGVIVTMPAGSSSFGIITDRL